jgi:TonB family protein
MLRPILVLILCLLFFKAATAQKGPMVYYLKNSGKLVTIKDSADYFLEIFPPVTNVDKNLNIVKAFYRNGKLMLIGGTTSYSLNMFLNIKFQGPYMAFYPNGNKMTIRNFENGVTVGGVIEYYPNGNVYTVKNYTPDNHVYLKQCNDSTGKVLTENGKGKWVIFNQDFDKVDSSGQVVDGLMDGEWRAPLNDEASFVRLYKQGKLLTSGTVDKSGKITYSLVQVMPQFPGGLDALGRFLGRNIRYPQNAMINGIQGRVIISFVVQGDGTLGGLRVARGIGGGCDEEALRVIKLSPRWKPGLINGYAVPVAFSVPISFTISTEYRNN